MKLLLTAISGSREGKVFIVEANECVTFGRTSLSKWSFEDDGHMSGVHFEVANLGTRGEVRDRDSTNGTWLNNEKITSPANLREGDRIRAGKTILTVEFSYELVPAVLVETDDIEKTHAPNPINDVDTDESNDSNEKLALEPRQTPTISSKVRTSNPFDSVDFAELKAQISQAAPRIVPSLPQTEKYEPEARRSFSPISDSSFVFTGSSKVAQHEILARRTASEAAESFAIVLDTLKSKWSAQLVVHFQKIRIATPRECEAKPLLRELFNVVATNFLPVRLVWNDTNSCITMPLLPRLCRSDACLAFFGRSAIEIGSQLDAMSSMGVEGFSEPNGFLPYFWPSYLMSIVQARGKDVCEQLFANRIAGVLMCAPHRRHEIFAIADGDLSEDLLAAEFRTIESFMAD